MNFSNGNGNGFDPQNASPIPIVRMLGQSDVSIPARPASASPSQHSYPLEVWPLAAGLGMLVGGFAVKHKDMKTALFGLGSTLTGISTVALFAKI